MCLRWLESWLLIVLLLGAPSGALQELPDQLFQTTSNLVLVQAVFTDKKGRPIRDMKADELSITDAGRGQRLAVFIPPSHRIEIQRDRSASSATALSSEAGATPLSLLIAIPGMGFGSRHYALEAIRKFLEKDFSPGTQVAIADATGAAQPFTTNAQVLRSFVDIQLRVTSPGRQSSRFMSAAVELLREMKSFEGPKAAIVFTDFFRTHGAAMGATPAGAFLGEALDSNIALYPIDARGVVPVIPYGDASTSEDINFAPGFNVRAGPLVTEQITGEVAALMSQDANLANLALMTGGRYEGTNDTEAPFRWLNDDAHSAYQIGYYVPDLVEDGKFHVVAIHVRRKGVRVRAKLGYLAPLKPNLRNAKLNKDLNWLLNADRPMTDVQISARAESVSSDGEQSTVCIRLETAWPLEASAALEGHLRIAARVISARGSIVEGFSRTLRYSASASESDGESVAKASVHFPLHLRPGNYLLQTAALLDTGAAGNATVPIAILPRKQPVQAKAPITQCAD